MSKTIENLKWRYAVKKFDADRILPFDKIELLKKAFNLSATSYGLQPIKMVVISNKNIQEQLVSFSYNQRQVAQASHVLVLCIQKTIDDAYIEKYFALIKKIRNTSDEFLDPFKSGMKNHFKSKTQDEIKSWARNQAYIALGNLMTVCAFEQIDACPMEGFQPKEYDKFLGLSDLGLQSVLVLPVGYRAEDDMFSSMEKVRKELSEVIIEVN